MGGRRDRGRGPAGGSGEWRRGPRVDAWTLRVQWQVEDLPYALAVPGQRRVGRVAHRRETRTRAADRRADRAKGGVVRGLTLGPFGSNGRSKTCPTRWRIRPIEAEPVGQVFDLPCPGGAGAASGGPGRTPAGDADPHRGPAGGSGEWRRGPRVDAWTLRVQWQVEDLPYVLADSPDRGGARRAGLRPAMPRRSRGSVGWAGPHTGGRRGPAPRTGGRIGRKAAWSAG